ncbi:YveK family protein [Brevibacillus fulvus]|uniref:Capsular polysaccharide biosynthesis protein n=1 Tax=Brevibacillus fulvus TaxID=1125967 RepID=A0A938XRG4_9BACL|nr:Wzz/FepE/Etk N-terminal domain-containing protein [Brevibacillus fulvus]MBM7588893.1 capsular polysaccharide biosynthesis protein [Brevibacillus fulvus]
METIDVSAIAKVLRKRVRLILLVVTLSVAISGWISFFVLAPQYEAKATFVVQGNSQGEDSLYNDIRANQELVKTYGAIIRSNRIAEEVIQSLQLPLTPEQLLKKIRVQETEQSLVTTIRVIYGDPATAARIANGIAESFKRNVGQIMKVDNVTILDEANPEGKAVQIFPQPWLYVAVVFFLSLLGSIGFSFFLEYLDQTIRSEEQIEQVLAIPVLGVISTLESSQGGKNRPEGVSPA